MKNKFFAILFVLGTIAMPYAQADDINPQIANCEEITDQATQTQVDFCTGHVGCKLVIGLQKACTKVKTFLNNLKNLTSGKSKIDSNDVFDAAAPSAEGDTSFNAITKSIKSSYDKQPKKEIVSGKFENGVSWVYEGGMTNGVRNGTGVLVTDTGTIFRGDFVEGHQVGMGELFNDKSHKAGVMVNAKMDGVGVERFASGTRYEGEFNADKPDGKGVMTWPNGERHEGSFKDAQFNGQGTHKYADGAQYTGDYVANKRHGRGTSTLANGARFEGEFRDGKPVNGTESKPDGTKTNFANGVAVKSPQQIAAEISAKYDQKISAARNQCATKASSCQSGCATAGVVGALAILATKGEAGGDTSEKIQQCSDSCDNEKKRCDQQVTSLEREKLQAIAEAKPKEPQPVATVPQQTAGGNSAGVSNSNPSATNPNWQSARTCDGQCVLLVAETKCKHIKNNQDNLSCLMQNGLGMNNDTPEICAQAKSLTGCMTKAEKLAARNSSETTAPKKYRYNSVCERNYEKIQNVMRKNNIEQAGATYDLFMKDIQWHFAKIFEPCASSSTEAARAYKVSMDEYNKINQYCAGSHSKYECTQWGANGGVSDNGGNPYNNVQYYKNFKAEVDKALSDHNYSADLGTVTGSGAVNAEDAACAASLKAIENQYSAAQRDIPKGSVVVLSEANMWRIAATLEKIKAQCPQSERYKAEAASIRSSYDEIKRVCDATASPPPCKPHLPGKEPVPVQAGNLLPELRKESTPEDCSGINWIQCRKRECMDRKGTFKVARGCAICITGQGGDWTRCPEGGGGVSSGQ